MARPPPTRWLIQLTVLVLLSGCAGAQQVGPTVDSVMRGRKPLPPATGATASVTPATAPVVAQATPKPPPLLEQKPWTTKTWRGVEFIDVREIAKRYELRLESKNSGTQVTLGDARGTRFTFEEKERSFYFDGLRVFLGEAPIQEQDSLWLSKLDVIKTIAPLFRPSEHAPLLPAASPKLIVLDPGHGGIDPGTENKKLQLSEKNLSLDVALRLQKILEARGWRVLLTRTEDRELSRNKIIDLQMRADFANKHGADLFLSIHFNAADEAVRGVEVYSLPAQHMLSSGSQKADERTGQSYPNNRFDCANLILGSELQRAMIGGLKASDRGYKRARWGMLLPVKCPAALIECAYLSNEAEARRAATPEYRQQIAQAISVGVQNYSEVLRAAHSTVAEPDDAAGAPSQKKALR